MGGYPLLIMRHYGTLWDIMGHLDLQNLSDAATSMNLTPCYTEIENSGPDPEIIFL